MSRRGWYVAGALLLLVAVCGLIGVASVKHGVDALVKSSEARELASEDIRPAFQHLTQKELPPKADYLRAVCAGGLHPWMFVRFTTDPNGVQHILEAFRGRRGTLESVDADSLRSGVKAWEKTFDVGLWRPEYLCGQLIEPATLGTARVLRGGPFRALSYTILIDDEHSTVYLYAYAR